MALPLVIKDCSKIKIRNIQIGDIPKIYALGEKLFSAEMWTTLYRFWNQYEIAELFFSDTEYCLVAEKDEKMLGFILGTVLEKPRTGRRYGHVLWLGVRSGYQGCGLADMFLRRIIRRFKLAGVQMVLADTAADNERAIRFFTRHHFNKQQDHVYLSRNMGASQQRSRSKN